MYRSVPGLGDRSTVYGAVKDKRLQFSVKKYGRVGCSFVCIVLAYRCSGGKEEG